MTHLTELAVKAFLPKDKPYKAFDCLGLLGPKKISVIA
jgi:hypothetical protein